MFFLREKTGLPCDTFEGKFTEQILRTFHKTKYSFLLNKSLRMDLINHI